MGLWSLLPLRRLHLDENGELLALRGMVSIILGYVLLYTPDIERSGIALCFGAVGLHLLSNLTLLKLPQRLLKAPWMIPAVFLADLALISWVMVLASHAETDLYLVYFLVILMSGMQRDIRLSFVVGGVASVLYGFLWCKANPVEDLFGAQMLLRFPFFFIISFFSACFAQGAQTGESSLRKAHDRLADAEKLASVGRLATGLAHEFNNILTGIIGSAELIEETLPPHDPCRQDARTVRELGTRAASLVALLLNFSRKQAVLPVRIDLRRFLIENAPRLRDALGERVEDRIEVPDGLPSVHMDREQLWQIIRALAVNAREAMGGAGTFTIECETLDHSLLPAGLHAEESEGYVRLSLRDHGRGMPPAVAARLFEPFHTTKPVGQGIGLSLASAYGIVRRAGGDLAVRTALGQGTTFEVYLPAHPAAETARPGSRNF